MPNNLPVKTLTVHCTLTPAGNQVDVEIIRRWNREAGYLGIIYHWIICRDGLVFPGRDEDVPAPKGGTGDIAVCLVGGYDGLGKANYTPEQWKALELYLGVLLKKYPKAELRGFRDCHPGKRMQEPCFDVKSWWADRLDASKRQGL